MGAPLSRIRIKTKEETMARWLLLALALCALATVADAGDCSAAETTAFTTCRQETDAKGIAMAPTSRTYDTMCKHYQDQLKCYPSCICKGKDAALVKQYNDAKKTFEDGLKMYDTSGSKTCNFQCGTGGAAAPATVNGLQCYSFCGSSDCRGGADTAEKIEDCGPTETKCLAITDASGSKQKFCSTSCAAGAPAGTKCTECTTNLCNTAYPAASAAAMLQAGTVVSAILAFAVALASA